MSLKGQVNNLEAQEEEIPVALQEVFNRFEDVFAEPKGLPLCRSQDQRIILKECKPLIVNLTGMVLCRRMSSRR